MDSKDSSNSPLDSGSRHPAWRDAGGILVRHRNGDQAAFRELLGKMQKPIYSYLVRSGLEPEAASSVFQDIFVRVHDFAGDYRQGDSFQCWLFSIAARELRDAYRKQRISRLLDNSQPKDISLDETLLHDSWVDRALLRLPFFQREAVLLCSTSGMKLSYAAESLELSVSATKELLRRSHHRLATIWAAEDLQPGTSIWKDAYCRKLRTALTEKRTVAVREDPKLKSHLRECGCCFSFLEALQEIESHLRTSPYSGPEDLIEKTLARVVYAESRQMRAVRDSLLVKAEGTFLLPGRSALLSLSGYLGRYFPMQGFLSTLIIALLSMAIGAAIVIWFSPK